MAQISVWKQRLSAFLYKSCFKSFYGKAHFNPLILHISAGCVSLMCIKLEDTVVMSFGSKLNREKKSLKEKTGLWRRSALGKSKVQSEKK